MYQVKQTKFAHDIEDGVTVEFLGRYYISYRIGHRLLVLPCETGGDQQGTHVETIWFPRPSFWFEPYGDQEIKAEERERIKNHLRDAVTALIANSRVEFAESTT